MMHQYGLFHQMFRCSVIIMVLSLMCSGCVVNHPEAYTSKPDYNNRIDVTGAHYKRKMTATGYTMLGVAAAGGAVAGWFVPMVSYYDGAEKKNLAPVNAAIGAVVGFGTSYFASRIMGWGGSRKVKDPKKWMKKSNPQYIVFDERDDKRHFRIIHRSAEQNYIVKNMSDVDDYRKAFPQGTHSDHMVRQCADALSRDELPKVLSYYPHGSAALVVKKKYVSSSRSVSDLFSAYDKFPETKLDVENMAIALVSDCGDALRFQLRYPSSRHLKKVLLNAVRNCGDSQAEKVKLSYGNDFNLSMEDILDLSPTKQQVRDYTNLLFRSKGFSNMESAARFYIDHPWLRYPEVKDDVMKNLWEVNRRVNSGMNTKQQQDAMRNALALISRGGRASR